MLKSYLYKPTSAAPLAVFRIGFGMMMVISIIRFWYHGWIEKLYIAPRWHFTYYGFEWVQPWGDFTYLLFVICGLSALGVALGLRYRLSIILFFLSFTYIELMDKTTYLNHYYFISVVSLLMVFLPMNRVFSLDNPAFALRQAQCELLCEKAEFNKNIVPTWTITSLKLLISTVYFYAGLAKINSDWLLRAQPLEIWLQSKYDLPLIGANLMQQEWFYYAMSWSGMIYDLSIPFLLWYRKTRVLGYVLVVVFHVFTRLLFPIGMFPFIMIVSALIFFDAAVHERILGLINQLRRRVMSVFTLSRKRNCNNHLQTQQIVERSPSSGKAAFYIVAVLLIVQAILPFRNLFYPGELFWHEQGFRFSWRVMLMDKVGYAEFSVVDRETGKSFTVDNTDFLTAFQEKQMSFQPDFILEYAHKLEDHFAQQGHQNIAIYVDSYVALNGRRSKQFVDPTVDLTQITESFDNKTWILPAPDEIKGL